MRTHISFSVVAITLSLVVACVDHRPGSVDVHVLKDQSGESNQLPSAARASPEEQYQLGMRHEKGIARPQAIQRPSDGIGCLPCKAIQTHNTNFARCLSEGRACRRIIKRRYVGVASPLIRVMEVRCSCSAVSIIRRMVSLRISCERICGATWQLPWV